MVSFVLDDQPPHQFDRRQCQLGAPHEGSYFQSPTAQRVANRELVYTHSILQRTEYFWQVLQFTTTSSFVSSAGCLDDCQ